MKCTARYRFGLQVTCLDSKGVRHKQLVKSGNDDLRQDAVMQQFFGLVNYILQANAATRKRQLKIRTYKVTTPSSRRGFVGQGFG